MAATDLRTQGTSGAIISVFCILLYFLSLSHSFSSSTNLPSCIITLQSGAWVTCMHAFNWIAVHETRMRELTEI